ncbi:MAG: HEPN domain-containing protein [Pseudomonadota bacterium]
MKKLIRYWSDQVTDALETAKALFRSGKFHFCLFFCHLAVERMLKAVVVSVTKDHAPYTHNLVFLAGKAGLELDDDRLHFLESLNEWCLSARYPASQQALYEKAQKGYALGLLRETEKFLTWLKKLL